MYRGQTCSYSYLLPVSNENDIDTIFITFWQDGKTILEKTKEDIIFDKTTAIISLSQAETLQFHSNLETYTDNKLHPYAFMQVRFKTIDGQAHTSSIMKIPIDEILKEGEI